MNIVTALLLAAFLVVGCSQRQGRLSAADRDAIGVLINEERKGNIMEMERNEDGTVKVFTQIPGKPGGDLLTVMRTNGGWNIILRGVWMN